MMRRLIGIVVMMMSMTGIYLAGSQLALAEEMSFSVEAKLPDNQRDKSKTYFDVRVQPGKDQELAVELKNNTDEEVTVLIQTNTAITNMNGIIDYGVTEPKLNATLASAFSDIAKVEPEVTLAAKEVKKINVNVSVPPTAFSGIILGGLHFSEKEKEGDKKAEAGVQIENKFAYVIGVRLSENDEPVESDLELLAAKAGQRNFRNTILASLQNPTPRIIGDMKVTADVYAANNLEAPIFHSTQQDLNMAPNSDFDYGIEMSNKAYKAGKYVLKMLVEADGKSWNFEKKFEIKADEAKKFNDKAVELAEESNDNLLYIIIGGVVLGVVILILVIWIIKQKKDQAKASARRAGKKSKSHSTSRKKRS